MHALDDVAAIAELAQRSAQSDRPLAGLDLTGEVHPSDVWRRRRAAAVGIQRLAAAESPGRRSTTPVR